MEVLCWKPMSKADGFLRSLGVETRFLAERGAHHGHVFAASSLDSGHDHQLLEHGCQRTMFVIRWYDEKFLKNVCKPYKINRIP